MNIGVLFPVAGIPISHTRLAARLNHTIRFFINEIFDEYALGTLESEEKRAIAYHVKVCSECARKLEAARARVALLSLAAPPLTPSLAVKDRLLAQIRSQAPSGVQAPAPARRRSSWIAPALAAAAIVLAIIMGVFVSRNHQLNRRLRALEQEQESMLATQQVNQAQVERARTLLEVLTAPETIKISLTAAQAHPAPQGKAFYNPQKGLVFYAANLPPPPAGRTYQLWLVPSQGAPISAGIFETDKQGDGQVVLPPLPRGVTAKAFAVTLEPAGGRPQPTGKKVLIGAVS